MQPNLDPKHPGNVADPYPLYAWLRENDPVHWSESFRGWIITRYEDVNQILLNPARFSSDRFRKLAEEFASRRPAVQAVTNVMREWFIFNDPPDHTRMRRLLRDTFTPLVLRRMEPRIQEVIDGLLDQAAGREEMDFIRDFAFPLPATVIAVILGSPVEDIDDLKRWSDQITAFVGASQDEADNMEEAKAGLESMVEYFRSIIKARRAKPRDDLISLMLAADDDGAVLSDDDVAFNCPLLVVAGHETTANLLGNGLYHLLRNPGQYRILRDNPDLVPRAVEEFLRFDGPVPGVVRIAAEELEMHGRTIRRGEMMFVFMNSANRDPAQFPDPDVLDITRESNRHLSFGYGIHFCLGAPLARLEARLAISTLMTRFGGLTLLNESPEWIPQIFLRGLKSLPIALHPLAPALAVAK